MIDSTKSRPASPRSRSLPVSGRRHAPRTLYVKDRAKNLGRDWTNPDTSYAERLSACAGYWNARAMKAARRADRWRTATFLLMWPALFLAGLEWEWGMACGLACMLAAGLCTMMERIEIRIIRHAGTTTVVMLPAVPANETRRRGMSDHPAGKGRKQ